MPGAWRTLPRPVVAVGLVSLFNDLASEMVVPMMPILLAGTLGAGPVALGLIEGIADAVASALKLWAGRASDLAGGRRKPLMLAGYGLSNLVRPLLAAAATWPAVLVLRALDRVGKGTRSAPRDALLADVTAPEIRGYAYGFHRAMDNAGAVGGALLAAAALAWTTLGVRGVIAMSVVPGALALAALAFGVRDLEPAVASAPTGPRLAAAPPAELRRYLGVLALFGFARVSETFLILRGHELGVPAVHLLVLWAGYSLAKALTGTRGGRFGDRLGQGAMLAITWGMLSGCWLVVAGVSGVPGLWVAALATGLATGFGEGSERALIGEHCPAGARGTAFGWYHLVTGLAAIPAGLAFGGLWQAFGAPAAFASAGAVGAASTVLLRAWAFPPAHGSAGPR